MKLVSQSELADLTGMTWRTVRKRLVERGVEPKSRTPKSALFDSGEALAALYERAALDAGELNPEQERARRDKEAADKLAMENGLRRGELLDANLIGEDVARWLTVFRSAMLRAPTKLAPLVNPEKPGMARALIETELHQILTELSESFSRPDGNP